MTSFFWRSWLLICLFIISLSACSHTTSSNIDKNTQASSLTHTLEALSPHVLSNDASEISKILITTAVSLSDEYDMVSPALYHNMLVNMGFRDRGLCCHWAEDLQAELRNVNAGSLKYAWLVARQGSQLREHNSIVIYAEGLGWQQGIVFDPWRKAGVPFWTAVTDDEYPWELHPLNGRWDVLRCK